MPLPRPPLWACAGAKLRSAARDTAGATAVEFAIVAVPFFGLMLLILQVGLWHFSLQSLDFAVRQAGRTIMTNQVSSSAVTASTFKTTYICPKVFWGMSCDKVVINSYILGKSSEATKSSGVYAYIDTSKKALKDPATAPSSQQFCLGTSGDYVYLDIAYPYPNFVSRLLNSSAENTWQMRSSTVIFNEPSAKSSGAAC